MSGLGRLGLFIATLVAGLGASYLLTKWWSPVCHEGCLQAIQLSMWLFLLVLPLALAGVIAVAVGRPRPITRIGLALAVLAVPGMALTAVAVWFQGGGHGG